jgi:hypothetical protein
VVLDLAASYPNATLLDAVFENIANLPTAVF